MKTLILLLTFIITVAGIPVNAQETSVSDNNTGLIFSKIQQSMHVPLAMKEAAIVSAERFRVTFTIDEKGQAHVVNVDSNRKDINASVIEQFEAIDFSASPDNGINQYSIWLTFKVL